LRVHRQFFAICRFIETIALLSAANGVIDVMTAKSAE
jgi:hypothetical protein